MSHITSLLSKESVRNVLTESFVIVFKHSTRCSTSAKARKEFEKFAEDYHGEGKLYLIDVIANRDVSNEISSLTGINHQSPQVLVIKNGTVIWHTSHWKITQEALQDAVV